MQWNRFAITGAVVVCASIAHSQTQDDFFNDRMLQEIRLEVRPSDLADLRLHYLENTYYPADFQWKFNDSYISVSNVGIRSRGTGSRSPDKPNLRVDFNRFNPNAQFLGMSAFVLKANNQDGSMLRELTMMKLWDRTGLPASREAFSRVFINGQYSGMYVLVEEIRNPYIERYLGERGGDLYEFEPVAEGYRFEWNPICATATQIACSADPKRWANSPFNPQENGSTFDITPTIDLIRNTSTVADEDFERIVGSMIDFSYTLSFVAMENYTSDFDGFLGDVYGMNNTYFYRYKGTNLHQIVPWDKDGTYFSAQRPIFWNADGNALLRRILAIPQYRARYLDAAYMVARLAGGPGGWLEREHERQYNLGRDSIYEDPVKQIALNGVLSFSSNEIFEREVAKNRMWLQGRTPFVLEEVAGSGRQPSQAVMINQGGVGNVVGGTTPAAPGSYISIYGSGFSQSTETASSAPFPTSLGGVSVLINGFFAPIQFVSPTQINALVPWELGMSDGTAPVSILVNGPAIKGTRAGSPVNSTISNAVITAVGPYAPGVFAVTRADGQLTAASPAGVNDDLVIYANGLGSLREQVASGAAAPLDHLVHTADIPLVTVDGIEAEVKFSGLAPGLVGCYQVNIVMPAGVRSGTAPLEISIGGQKSLAYPISAL